MAGIGILLIWAGYSTFYYGLNTVRGGNESFMSLVWPGRFRPVARDSKPGSGSGSKGAPLAAPAVFKDGQKIQSGTGPFGKKAVPHPR